MEMLFAGRWIDAEEAHRRGSVNRNLPAAALMEAARARADDFAAGPRPVFAAIGRVLRGAGTMAFPGGMNRIARSQLGTVERLRRPEDRKEDARAFAEKRDPVWKGR